MKSISKYIIMGAFALAVTGCDLDMQPETTMTDTGFWKTETDLRGACNRFYEQLNGNNDLGGGFTHDKRSDELAGTNGQSQGNWTIPSTNGAWTDSYWRINIPNNTLEKSPKAAVPEDILNRYQAEAKFFRAYYYFELTKKYGDVPLLLKTIDNTTDPDLKMGRTPREEVIKQVYEDLDFASQWLPDIDNISAKDWGQVSRQAALAMIVRVGLYTGTHGKYHKDAGCDPNHHLTKAVEAARNLIVGDNKGKFELYYDFEKLFQDEAEGRGNRENIFVKVYGPNGAATTNHRNSRDLETGTSLTRNIVDLFLYTDGLPREKSPLAIIPETSYDDIFSNRDPRLGMTIYKIGEEAYKGAFNPFAFGTGYSIKKGFS